MITRYHASDHSQSSAVYSDCETYRYALTRSWQDDGRKILFVMLNPSTATETQNDPTIERCERRARALGYGALQIMNLFALRETDPAKMRRAKAPIGPDNESMLMAGAAWADDILCAWGVHGAHQDQGPRVAALMRATGKPLMTLGLTKDGHPRHPLYISYSQRPALWTGLPD